MAQVLDNLTHGADVVASDGRQVGKLHAVVVDPRDNEVTHIVVNTGPHFPEPGFGAPDLVEVPIEEMKDAAEGRVSLHCSRERFRGLPPYVERAYMPPAQRDAGNEDRRLGHVLWKAGVALAGALASFGGIGVPRETFQRASFERHILNDAPVWRSEPHTHLGDIERVLVDEESDEIEALVIRRGVLFPHEVVLPVEYVTEILDGVVHADISDDQLGRLKEYRP